MSLPPDLDLNLPDGGVGLPGPALMPSAVFFRWIEERMAWLASTGELERILADPARQPVDVPFVWIE